MTKEKVAVEKTMDEEEEIKRPAMINSAKKGPTGAPAWVVTFADLATLMLTFFVLLLSFANMDIVRFREMLGSVQQAFGVQTKTRGEYQATLKGPSAGAEVATSTAKVKEKKKKEEIADALRDVAAKTGLSESIKVITESKGVRIRVKGQTFFGAGSAELKNEALLLLDGIVKLMKEAPLHLSVEGHTDNIPISTNRFPSNWELSAVRATTVLRYIMERGSIPQERLMAIGFADNKPLGPNNTPENRAKNRRVEFLFTKK
ncbi:MAG: flagellar motor protein MotB [Nitrospinota bacterium]